MWHLWPPPVVCGSSAAWFVADMFLELGDGDIVSLVGLSFEGTAALDAIRTRPNWPVVQALGGIRT